MYTPEQWAEILQLRKKIEKDGFKKHKFHYVTDRIKKRNDEPLEFCTHIRIHKNKPVSFKENLDLHSKNVGDLYEVVNEFLQDLTEAIWRHNQHKKKEFDRRMMEQEQHNFLENIRKALKKAGYGKQAVEGAIQILEEDLEKRFQEFKTTPDYKYFFQSNPRSHAWLKRENDVIKEIRALYKRSTNPSLSDRKIISSMAIIFATTKFWTDHLEDDLNKRIETYCERIKKRFQVIDKDQSEPWELFDPS